MPMSQGGRGPVLGEGSTGMGAWSRCSWSDGALDEWRAGTEEDPGEMISVTGTSRRGSWGLLVMMYPLFA
jgi:hypothetical protein